MGDWGGVGTTFLSQQCLEETEDKIVSADRQYLGPPRQDHETTKQ